MEQTERRRPSEFQNDDACGLLGWKAHDLSEITIHRNKRAAFSDTGLKNTLVSRTGQSLLSYGHDIMAALFQHGDAAAADVLVDLDPHSAGSTGTGITRSRAASAP